MIRLLGPMLACSLAWPSLAHAAPPNEAIAPAPAERAQPSEPAVTAAESATTAAPPETVPPPPAAATAPISSSPSPPPPPPPRPPIPKSGEPLIIAGASVAVGMYLFTSFAGAVAIDKARKHRDIPLTVEDERGSALNDEQRGKALLIPFAGPFIAMRFTDSAKRRYGLALNGSIQLVGLTLALVGIVQERRHRRAKRWQLTANAGSDGAQLGMKMRF